MVDTYDGLKSSDWGFRAFLNVSIQGPVVTIITDYSDLYVATPPIKNHKILLNSKPPKTNTKSPDPNSLN